MDAAERRCATLVRCRVPFGEIESRRDADVPIEAGVGVAEQRDSTFAPRRGNDRRLDRIAKNTVIGGRLVAFVQKPQRDQYEARARAEMIGQFVLDVEL